MAAIGAAHAAEAPGKPQPDAGINFDTVIMQIDGKTPVPVESCEPLVPNKKCVPLTLKRVCTDVLITDRIPGDSPNPDEKKQRFFLAMQIENGKRVLTVEDIALLKKVIGLGYGPLVVGRTTELLDPAAMPK